MGNELAINPQSRESSEYYSLLEQLPDFVFVINSDFQIKYANKLALEGLGYAYSDLSQHNILDFLLADEMPYLQTALKNSMLASNVTNQVFRFRAASGEWLKLEANLKGSSLLDGVLLTAHDVTARDLAEEKARVNEQHLLRLFDAALAPCAISTVKDGTYLVVNNNWLKTTGYSREEVVGKQATNLVWINFKDRQTFLQLLLVHGSVFHWETNFRLKSGEVRQVAVSAEIIEFENEPCVASTVIDVTEYKNLAEELRHSEEKLRQSQKMEALGRLAGGVAHDFNNLLTAIVGYADLILVNPDTPELFQEDVNEIKASAERAAELTRQLLAFSRKQVLQPRVFDLNVVVCNLNKMLQRLIGEDSEIVIATSQTPAFVKADLNQIEQVIINLAVNARDAMPDGGKIVMETANVFIDEQYVVDHVGVKPGFYVRLSVSDSGEGMDAETMARIFEPFFTTKEMGRGTGLGLSTVYGVVKQSGGNIWVYSEQGVGTTFKVYLPSAEVPQAVKLSTANVKSLEQPLATEATILLVEDEPSIRKVVQRVLVKNGFNVLVAANGKEALELSELYPEKIHLLLTDVIMPVMGGRELTGLLRQVRPETQVLYMSGYSDRAIVRNGVLDEGTSFLEKPFDLETVVRTVREILKLS